MQGGGGGKVATAVLPLKSLLLAKPPPWPWTSRHNAIDFSNLDLQPPLTADVVVLLQLLLLPPIMVSFDRSIIKRVYYHRAAAAAFHHLVSIHSDVLDWPNKKHNQCENQSSILVRDQMSLFGPILHEIFRHKWIGFVFQKVFAWVSTYTIL